MTAKSDFFTKIQYLRTATESDAVKDGVLTDTVHNGTANLLRKGLGIVGFNILEDFIKYRVLEVADLISNLSVTFDDLPDKFQKACTYGALAALPARAKLNKQMGYDDFSLIRDEAYKIYSTGQSAFGVSKFSFGWSQSNLSADEVKDILNCFAINNLWQSIKSVSDSIGGGLTSPQDSFTNAATRRHSSAHSSVFTYQYSWLHELPGEILALSASIDILLMARYRQINMRRVSGKIDNSTFNINDGLNFVYLEEDSGKYRQTVSIGNRARRIWPDLASAILFIKPGLERKQQFLIILDGSKRLKDWHY